MKVSINYLTLPSRINLQESVEEIAVPEGKTKDEVLTNLFSVRSIKIEDGAYQAIEVVAVREIKEEQDSSEEAKSEGES